MKLDSKFFDRIRIRPDKDRLEAEAFPMCEWEGCDRAGPHRAPKGRGAEGQYHHFCVDHVRLYNKSYNYFDGMNDAQVRAYQKDALTGHRPTWRMGIDEKAAANGKTATSDFTAGMQDPFGLFEGARRTQDPSEREPRQRKLKSLEKRSLETLNLDASARGPEIKARYKELVKRHHPDANGGDRSSEERLGEIIQAYNILKQAGLC